MEIEIINNSKEEIELVLKEEDVAFYKLIEDIASSKKDVEFVAIKKADHVKPEFSFYMKVKGQDVKKVLLSCIEEAESQLENILENIEKTLPKKE